MKSVLRALAALFLVLAAALGTAMPASAAPTPAPTAGSGVPTFVEYTGHSTSSVTAHYSSHGALPSSIRIDCDRQGTCVVTTLTIDDSRDGGGVVDMSQGRRLVLVDGKGSFAMPAFGTTCGPVGFGVGELTLVATATGFTGTRTSAASGTVTCPDGSTVTQAAGVFTATATLSGGNPCVLDGSCPTPTPIPSATAHPRTAAGTTTKYTKATHFSSPSTLSALPTASAALTVHGILWAAAVTVVLVLLVAFPTHLFNTATEEGTSRIRQWWAKRRPRVVRSISRAREVEYRGWPLAAIGVLAASLISSFVDPTFGINASSVRVYLSILVSFLLDAVAGWFLLIYLVRRTRPHTSASFRFSPISLLVVLGAVLFTRITGFAPGIIFGLVAGVAFGTVLATAEKARVALVGLGYSFVVAVLGWVGYSLLGSLVGAHPGAGIVFVQETLSSMAIGGIAALPIALIPLRGLTGYDVFRWNRWVWGGAYAIGLLGFFVVLMPLPFSWAGVHVNLVVWIAVYVAYALASIVAWLVVVRPWRREKASEATASPDAA